MNILIADGSKNQQDKLTEILKTACKDAVIFTADSIDSFNTVTGNNIIDIAFLESHLENKTGSELALELKARSAQCNIIFITADRMDARDVLKSHPSGIVKKPFTENDIIAELNELRYPIGKKSTEKKLRVITFGNFIVYDSMNKLMNFTLNRSKELFAYLIDQNGYSVTSTDIAKDVLEKRRLDKQISKNISKYVTLLLGDLKRAGAANAVIKQNRILQINKNCIDCDLYNALEGDASALNGFHGEYLQEYSWAEATDSRQRLTDLFNSY